MSVNLLNLFKDQIGGSALSGISSMLGESEENTGSAMTGIAAALMGSLAGKASTASGAAGLLSDLGNADTGVLGNITSILGGGDKSSFLDGGSKLVSSLLGNNSNSVIDAITGAVGIGKGNTSTLMSVAAPLVMGFLGKYVKSKALDAVGLGSLLGSQKDHIKSALPGNLFSSLGFSSIGGAASSAAGAAADTVQEAASNGGGFLKPLLIALAILALAFFGYKSCNRGGDDHGHDHDKDGGHKTEELKKDDMKVDDSIGDIEADTDHDDHAGHDHAKTDEVVEMDSKGFTWEQGTWEWSLYDYLQNGTGPKSFVLDKIPFEGEEVSAEGKKQLDNLAEMLKAYPDLKAEVQAHSNKAKNKAGALKKKATTKIRAGWVHLKLKARGVAESQVSSKGYGDEQLLTSIPEDDNGQKRLVIRFNK